MRMTLPTHFLLGLNALLLLLLLLNGRGAAPAAASETDPGLLDKLDEIRQALERDVSVAPSAYPSVQPSAVLDSPGSRQPLGRDASQELVAAMRT